MNHFDTVEQAAAALEDPRTTADDLSTIAAEYPVLWPAIARHPNAYPDLLVWLGEVGDDQVRQAIRDRENPQKSTMSRKGIIAIVVCGVCAILGILAVIVFVYMGHQPQENSDQPTYAAETTSSASSQACTVQLEFRRVYNIAQVTTYAEGQALELPTVPDSTDDRPSTPTTNLPTDQQGRLDLLTDQLAWTPSDTDNRDFTGYQCGDSMPQVWDQPYFACTRDDVAATNGSFKYLLGPRLVEGELITTASAEIPQNQTNWVVNVSFNPLGTALFSQATQTLAGSPSPTDQFAILLDGKVMSAPSVNEEIPDGAAQISGSFDEQTAETLANTLNQCLG